MAYVDLNPIRAGIAQRLDVAAHTSAVVRLAQARKAPDVLTRPLGPILGVLRPSARITTADYLQLLAWTGRQLAPGQRGKVTGDAPACLRAVDADAARWTTRVREIGSGYWRAVGSAKALIALAKCIGQQWLKGLRLAERLG
ncbi:MAG: hypothetical protein ACKOEC_21510 [Acidimicrobiia bacterium]